MSEIEVRRRRSAIELVVPHTITGTAERLIALLEQTIGRIKDEDQDRVRERAEAFIRDEPEVALAVAKLASASASASVIEGATIVAPKSVGEHGLIHIGPVLGRSGVLSLEKTCDGVIVQVRSDGEVFHIGRWDLESRELKLSMSGVAEIEQAVRAMCRVRDVQRVRVVLPSGDRVIFHRGGNVEHVVGAPGARSYAFAKDKGGRHPLYPFGIEVPSEAVQVAEAIMRGMYA